MSLSKKNLLLLILVVFFIGGFTLKVFPDPYYHEERVTFFDWLYREIDELAHGERQS